MVTIRGQAGRAASALVAAAEPALAFAIAEEPEKIAVRRIDIVRGLARQAFPIGLHGRPEIEEFPVAALGVVVDALGPGVALAAQDLRIPAGLGLDDGGRIEGQRGAPGHAIA